MASATKPPSYPPNQTLYLTNLPSSKIQKYDIRLSLYTLFSTYGPVLDVVALKTQKMRGQAHITYRDIQTATQAMRALQGFEFFGYKIQIHYAKTKSDTLSKLDGTFRQPTAQNQPNVETTTLQQSIFNAPPSSSSTTFALPTSNLPPLPQPQATNFLAAATSNLPPAPGASLPVKPSLPLAPAPGPASGLPPPPGLAVPVLSGLQDTNMEDAPTPGSVAGVKRGREEDEEEEEEQEMEEDSDGDAAMEEDSDDD